MNDGSLPYSLRFDLASLGDAEKTVVLSPSAVERAAIAAWAGIDALDTFTARETLRRTGDNAYALVGTFVADLTQSCVVTLEPVRGHLEGEVARHYRVLPPRARRHPAPEDIAVPGGGDEDEEVLESGVVDLAQPVLEDLLLAIDPYPRAPGATFERPSDPDNPANPFAVLQKLKGKG
jgi:uncharacterized metal-binding protein YceD (DUF177 family)